VLLRGSEESEERTLTIVGVAAALCLALIGGLLLVFNPFAGLEGRRISVTIDTPYAGQGTAKGTAVVMHGVKVGEVTAISSLAGGGVQLVAALQPGPVMGLTNTMNIDFRPVNYFGVTGINIIPNSGGQSLRDGMRINTIPKGNFTLQALLYRFGEISTGVLTPRMIQVIDRATRYVDALDPLVETMVIAVNAIADVQTVRTAQLLTNTTEFSASFPAFVDSLTETGYRYIHPDQLGAYHTTVQQMSDEGFNTRQKKALEYAAFNIFGSAGKLLQSHVGDLLPVVDTVKALTDVVPPLIRPDGIGDTLVEMRSRFEKMYAGTPEQRGIQVRIVLDSLPGVAAPLGAIGGP
jgi:hypothetical protein